MIVIKGQQKDKMSRHNIMELSRVKKNDFENKSPSEMKQLHNNIKQLQKQMSNLLKVKRPKESDVKRLCFPSSIQKINEHLRKSLEKSEEDLMKFLRKKDNAEQGEKKEKVKKLNRYDNQVKLRNSIKRIRMSVMKNKKQCEIGSQAMLCELDKARESVNKLGIKYRQKSEVSQPLNLIHETTNTNTSNNDMIDATHSKTKLQSKASLSLQHKKFDDIPIKKRIHSFSQSQSQILQHGLIEIKSKERQAQQKSHEKLTYMKPQDKLGLRKSNEKQKLKESDLHQEKINDLRSRIESLNNTAHNTARNKEFDSSQYVLVFDKKNKNRTKINVVKLMPIQLQIKAPLLMTMTQAQKQHDKEQECTPWDQSEDCNEEILETWS